MAATLPAAFLKKPTFSLPVRKRAQSWTGRTRSVCLLSLKPSSTNSFLAKSGLATQRLGFPQRRQYVALVLVVCGMRSASIPAVGHFLGGCHSHFGDRVMRCFFTFALAVALAAGISTTSWSQAGGGGGGGAGG